MVHLRPPQPPTMTESNLLFETAHYSVTVGITPWTDFNKDTSSQYLIVNKETGVVEAEHRVKAYAFAWAVQFEELMESFNENQGKVPPKGEKFTPSFEGIPTPPET